MRGLASPALVALRLLRAVLVAAQLLLAGCVGPEKPDVTGRVEAFDLDSAAVGDAYRIFVRLPPEYEGVGAAARSFPLVVQLDANLPTLEQFAVTAGFASRLESDGELPPLVGVRVAGPLTITARLLAPFPYATEVISYVIPAAGVSLRL